MRHRPIFVMACMRTRSSLVANILIEHGVWCGESKIMKAGYPCHENEKIKRFLIQHYGPLPDMAGKGEFFYEHNPDVDLPSHVHRVVPYYRPWFFKCAVHYYKLLAVEDWDPRWIWVYRNPGDTIKSYLAKANPKDPLAERRKAKTIIEDRLAAINSMSLTAGGVLVDTDQLVDDNFETIQKALEYCEIEYDYDSTMRAFL